ncbi:MAG: FkbM family methyltransferase [Roseobacter sp.]
MALHPLKTRAPYLKGYGFTPDTVFDVGVADGTPWLYRSFPDADFVLIDPLPGAEASVRARGHIEHFDFFSAALGAEETRAVLTVPHSDKGREGAMASLLQRTDQMAERKSFADEVEVPIVPLDDIAQDYLGSVGLKIDTEGYEFEILKGAPDTLERCEFVILEMSVTPRFEGVSLPSETVALLADAGLQLRDVLHVGAGAGKKARPRYFDILFARWPQ